jgi:hypothetical protein
MRYILRRYVIGRQPSWLVDLVASFDFRFLRGGFGLFLWLKPVDLVSEAIQAMESRAQEMAQ